MNAAPIDPRQMSSDQCRQHLIEYMAGKGWLGSFDLHNWQRETFGCSKQTAHTTLRRLEQMGLLERRRTIVLAQSIGMRRGGTWTMNEWRVVEGGER